jgi:hypothetical protein
MRRRPQAYFAEINLTHDENANLCCVQKWWLPAISHPWCFRISNGIPSRSESTHHYGVQHRPSRDTLPTFTRRWSPSLGTQSTNIRSSDDLTDDFIATAPSGLVGTIICPNSTPKANGHLLRGSNVCSGAGILLRGQSNDFAQGLFLLRRTGNIAPKGATDLSPTRGLAGNNNRANSAVQYLAQGGTTGCRPLYKVVSRIV